MRLLEEKIDWDVEIAQQDYLSMVDDWPFWNAPEVEQVKAEISSDPRWQAWVESIK